MGGTTKHNKQHNRLLLFRPAALQVWKHVEPCSTGFAQNILHRVPATIVAQGVQQLLEPLPAAISNLLFALKDYVRLVLLQGICPSLVLSVLGTWKNTLEIT